DRLRDEHAVERVGVNRRKARERDGVLRGDGKLVEPVRIEGVADRRGVGGEILAPARGLDRDLPEAGRAVEELVPAVLEEPRHLGGQLPRSVDVPEQQLRVDEEAAHFRLRFGAGSEIPENSASISFSNIVLKSSGTG